MKRVFTAIALLATIAACAQPIKHHIGSTRATDSNDIKANTIFRGGIRVPAAAGTDSTGFWSRDSKGNLVVKHVNTPRIAHSVAGDTVTYLQEHAGILRFNRVGGVNTPVLLNDGDHHPINCDSVAFNGNDIEIYFPTANKIFSCGVENDETTGGMHQGQETIANIIGGYTGGGSVLLNKAIIRISKPVKLTAQFTFNGTSWVVTGVPNTPTAINWLSPALTVTYSAGRVRINTAASFEMNGYPMAVGIAVNGDPTLMYTVHSEFLSKTLVDIYFSNAAGKLTAGTPPTGLSFAVDFGVAQARVNPATEDFGSSGNFFIRILSRTIK